MMYVAVKTKSKPQPTPTATPAIRAVWFVEEEEEEAETEAEEKVRGVEDEGREVLGTSLEDVVASEAKERKLRPSWEAMD